MNRPKTILKTKNFAGHFGGKAKKVTYRTEEGDSSIIIKVPYIFGRPGVLSGTKELWIHTDTLNNFKATTAEYFPNAESKPNSYSGQIVLKDYDNNFIIGYSIKSGVFDSIVSYFKYSNKSGVDKSLTNAKTNTAPPVTLVCYSTINCVDTYTLISGHPEYGTFYRKDCYVIGSGCSFELAQILPPSDIINLLSPNNSGYALYDATLDGIYRGLTPLERQWLLNNPEKMYIALNNKEKAEQSEKTRYCNSPADGSNNNAFKHAYWSALNTKSFGYEDALDLAWAHEIGATNQNQNSMDMDMHNNGLGINIVRFHRNWSDEQIRNAVQNAIDMGQGIIFNNPLIHSSGTKPLNTEFKCQN